MHVTLSAEIKRDIWRPPSVCRNQAWFLRSLRGEMAGARPPPVRTKAVRNPYQRVFRTLGTEGG